MIGVPVGSTALEHRALLEAAEEASIRPVTALDDVDRRRASAAASTRWSGACTWSSTSGAARRRRWPSASAGVLAHRTSKLGRGRDDAGRRPVPAASSTSSHVGELEAEQLKVRSAAEDDGPLVVQGRDAVTGRARLATVQAAEVADAVRPLVDEIVRTLAACLDDLPPQALADVLAEGVLVFGGASLVQGFAKELERGLGLPVKLAERAPDMRRRRAPPGRCATAALLDGLRPELTVTGACSGPVARMAGRFCR